MSLTFFKLSEFTCKCGCGQNKMDPQTLNRFDTLRAQFGKPLIVTSGYRCPEHNAKVSSTGRTGPHTTGQAADFAVDRVDAHKLLQIALTMGFTGIGVQQKGGGRFIHLDTLSSLQATPRPTVWSY